MPPSQPKPKPPRSTSPLKSPRGRGTPANPKNRFERYERIAADTDDTWRDDTEQAENDRGPRTTLLRDATRAIIARNDSPDLGFSASVNPYRGCEHGCIYCYARPTHEYLGFSAGLDFESKILVKTEAPALLREALASPKWTPQVIALSGVTDAYQPSERKLEITRGCLKVLVEYRNPVFIITKNFLVTRDIDLLGELAQHQAVAVMMSITTLDGSLARVMEPRASHPGKRLEAVARLAQAGIPVGVNLAPIIPGLTDEEIPALVQAAKDAGAQFAGMQPVRLPHGLKDLFSEWLGVHFPQRKEKVLNRIRAIRGDKLNDSRFGARMRGEGVFAEQMWKLFALACRKADLSTDTPALSACAFRRPAQGQLTLF
jgi:DNA repair photolyase